MLQYLRLGLCLTLGASSIVTAQSLTYPVDVAVDEDDVVFVADHEEHALLKLGDSGFEVVAKGEGLPRTPLYGIRHIAPAPDGSWLASDPATMKLYRITPDGTVGAVPDDDRFVTPWGIALEASGEILAVDRVTQRLRRIKKDATVEDVLEIRAPRAILFDKEGTIVVLTDTNLLRVTGASTSPIAADTPFEFPHDAVLHPDGNFYVTDGYAKAIWKVTPDGTVSAFVQGEPLMSPQGIAVDKKGNLLVADAHARTVFRVSPEGELNPVSQ